MPSLRYPDAEARQEGQDHQHRIYGCRARADQRRGVLLQQSICEEHDESCEQ